MIQSQQVLEWQAEARIEGKAVGKAETLLEMLEARFGTVPADAVERVLSIRDVDQLKRLVVPAVRCASLDEFRAALPPEEGQRLSGRGIP